MSTAPPPPPTPFPIAMSSVLSQVAAVERRVYLESRCDAFPRVMLQSDDAEELTTSLIEAPTSNASTIPSERPCPRDREAKRHRCRLRHKDDNSQTDDVLQRTADPNYKATAPHDGFCEAMFNSLFVHSLSFSPLSLFHFSSYVF